MPLLKETSIALLQVATFLKRFLGSIHWSMDPRCHLLSIWKLKLSCTEKQQHAILEILWEIYLKCYLFQPTLEKFERQRGRKTLFTPMYFATGRSMLWKGNTAKVQVLKELRLCQQPSWGSLVRIGLKDAVISNGRGTGGLWHTSNGTLTIPQVQSEAKSHHTKSTRQLGHQIHEEKEELFGRFCYFIWPESTHGDWHKLHMDPPCSTVTNLLSEVSLSHPLTVTLKSTILVFIEELPVFSWT